MPSTFQPRIAAIVKDYSTPAIEQGLAAWTDVQGRRWIILRGGNRGSGLVVRPRGCLISTVQVRVGENHSSVAEGNCVVARRGGEQLEAKDRSAG